MSKIKRQYLFLAESFYYALVCRHDKTASYNNVKVSEVKNPPTLPAWENEIDEVALNENLPFKFWVTVEQMTKKEIAVFKALAKLVVIDEDEEYYFYAPITNAEIQLYKDFGIGNAEFLLMEEFGLINIGARVDNPVSVEDELAGF